MLRKRLIVCLDVENGRVVKGTSFVGLRDMGDPVELAERYQLDGADEIVFLDISASSEGRRTLLDVVRRTAERLFIPLTVGGGIREVADVDAALRAGADKVAVNTSAVERPELISEAAARFGRQCVVVSVDARQEPRSGSAGGLESGSGRRSVGAIEAPPRYRVFTRGGRAATELDAVDWARDTAELGAGELLITSIDQDGRRNGYDLELTSAITRVVDVPVIASGGAGAASHIRDAFLLGGADAALAAGMFHDGSTTVTEVKRLLSDASIPVRTPA